MAFLSLCHTLSSSKASFLLPIAAVTPLPRPSSLPSKECAWARMAARESVLLMYDTAIDFSPSSVLTTPSETRHPDPAGSKCLHQTVDTFTGYPKTVKHHALDCGEREEFAFNRSYSPLLHPTIVSVCPSSFLQVISVELACPLVHSSVHHGRAGLYRDLLQLMTFNSCNSGPKNSLFLLLKDIFNIKTPQNYPRIQLFTSDKRPGWRWSGPCSSIQGWI